MKKRDVSIDLLRTIGFICVVLAHIDPPNFIFELRGFDVSLMVFASGMSYAINPKGIKSVQSYVEYVISRFFRLVVPTWITLMFFFIIFGGVIGKHVEGLSFSLNEIIMSFSLLDGIGYVWIMRVFFILAVFAPLFAIELNKMEVKMALTILALCLLICELLAWIVVPRRGFFWRLFEWYGLYLLSYGVVFILGMIARKIDRKTIGLIAFISLIIVLIRWSFLGRVAMKSLKYPPRLVYLLYGIGCSLLCFLLANSKLGQKMGENRVVQFISRNSMELYLWHIIYVSFFYYGIIVIKLWIIKYIIVLWLSCISCLLYNKDKVNQCVTP